MMKMPWKARGPRGIGDAGELVQAQLTEDLMTIKNYGDRGTSETITSETIYESNYGGDAIPDPERDVMMQAAAAHARSVAERDKLVRLVEEQNAGLKMKNEQLTQMELSLAEERNRVASYRAEADEMVRENARLAAGLAHVDATLAMLRDQLAGLALPAPPEKRRRGRKPVGDLGRPVVDPGNGENVPDASGGANEVAEGAAVLAHGEPLLGQRTEE